LAHSAALPFSGNAHADDFSVSAVELERGTQSFEVGEKGYYNWNS